VTSADEQLVHAVLARHGPCEITDLAAALGWTLERLERALTALAEALTPGLYTLVLDGRKLSISLAEDIVPDDVTHTLYERHLPRIALSAREARRLVELVRAQLTLSMDSVGPDPYDTELIRRAVLIRDSGPDEHEDWREPTVRPHPDVLFALGLGGPPQSPP
jgi:hypothetical protein